MTNIILNEATTNISVSASVIKLLLCIVQYSYLFIYKCLSIQTCSNEYFLDSAEPIFYGLSCYFMIVFLRMIFVKRCTVAVQMKSGKSVLFLD